jgi:ribosome-binding factor A
MIAPHRPHSFKKAQKEKLLLRAISNLFYQTAADDPELHGLSISRVELSPDKGNCTVFFYMPEGKEAFDQKLEKLKLYKPSMRAALASEIPGRYTPNIRFVFDATYEKQRRVEEILLKVSEELKKEDQ